MCPTVRVLGVFAADLVKERPLEAFKGEIARIDIVGNRGFGPGGGYNVGHVGGDVLRLPLAHPLSLEPHLQPAAFGLTEGKPDIAEDDGQHTADGTDDRDGLEEADGGDRISRDRCDQRFKRKRQQGRDGASTADPALDPGRLQWPFVIFNGVWLTKKTVSSWMLSGPS